MRAEDLLRYGRRKAVSSLRSGDPQPHHLRLVTANRYDKAVRKFKQLGGGSSCSLRATRGRRICVQETSPRSARLLESERNGLQAPIPCTLVSLRFRFVSRSCLPIIQQGTCQDDETANCCH